VSKGVGGLLAGGSGQAEYDASQVWLSLYIYIYLFIYIYIYI